MDKTFKCQKMQREGSEFLCHMLVANVILVDNYEGGYNYVRPSSTLLKSDAIIHRRTVYEYIPSNIVVSTIKFTLRFVYCFCSRII